MFSFSYFLWGLIGAAIFIWSSYRGGAALAIVAAIVGFILATTLAWFNMPSIALFLGDGLTMFFFLYLLSLIFAFAGRDTWYAPVSVGIVLLIGLFVLSFATSSSYFHAEKYANLMVPVQASRDATMPLTDQTQVRLVTPDLARKRAAELISSSDEQGIGSRVTIGEMWGNEVGGKMYWIAPLEHSGFWRWMKFDNTPGYIMVSQFNELDSIFVQNQPIKIGVNAYMGDNIDRLLYNKGYVDYDYGTPIFQVADDFKPYWIVPLLYPQVGFYGDMPVKWVLINATTGETQEFNKAEDVPQWVDRVYPAEIISERFNDWGCYKNGYWACEWSGENVLRSTPGISLTIDPSGQVVYYSGTQFQNAKSEGASSGVFLGNSRTGKMTFYPRAGITEDVAKGVIQQAYANYPGYTAADPTLIVVNGVEAYVSIVLDGNGSRKGFGLAAQDNRNIVGIGDSVQAAVSAFSRSQQRSHRDSAFEAGSKKGGESVEGLVVTYQPYVQNGKTVFYLSIDTVPNKIFEMSDEKISEVVATKVGDPVRITTENMDPGIVFVNGFDNLRIDLQEDGYQPMVDGSMADAKQRYKVEKDKGKVSALLHDLSSEEVDLLMQSYFEKRSKWRSGGAQ